MTANPKTKHVARKRRLPQRKDIPPPPVPRAVRNDRRQGSFLPERKQ